MGEIPLVLAKEKGPQKREDPVNACYRQKAIFRSLKFISRQKGLANLL